MFYFFPNLSKIIAFSSLFDQQPIKRSSHLSQQLRGGSPKRLLWSGTLNSNSERSILCIHQPEKCWGICTTSKVPKNGPCQTDANSGQNSPFANISWCNRGQKPRKMTLFKWVSRNNQTTFPKLPKHGGEYRNSSGEWASRFCGSQTCWW